jgi:phosphohistidine swiveling domain-containing protein
VNVIKGKVTIIKKRDDYYHLRNKAILIIKKAEPDLVIVINKVQAIVTEVDNNLCHAAIIAREFRKPILMGVKNAVKNFRNGDKVLINFDNKTIFKIK